MKIEFKCPWCGIDFQNRKELDSHARDHYANAVQSKSRLFPLETKIVIVWVQSHNFKFFTIQLTLLCVWRVVREWMHTTITHKKRTQRYELLLQTDAAAPPNFSLIGWRDLESQWFFLGYHQKNTQISKPINPQYLRKLKKSANSLHPLKHWNRSRKSST